MSNRILLMDIGAPPLPVVEPVVPRNASWFPVPYTPPPLPAPAALAAVPVVDAAQLRWVRTVVNAQTVIETAENVDDAPGEWTRETTVDGVGHTLSLATNSAWVRLRSRINGRESEPGVATLVSRNEAASTEAVAAAAQAAQDAAAQATSAQATADHADALTVPGSGVHLGDQRQQVPTSVASTRSLWDGLTLTATYDSESPANVMLTASAATLRMGTARVDYASASTTVQQPRGTTARYYAYFLDLGYDGEARTLNVSTDQRVLANDDGVVWVGEFVVAVASTGGGSGGGSGGGGGGRPPGTFEPHENQVPL